MLWKMILIQYQTELIKEKIKFLFLSNLIESKGIIDLIEACVQLKKSKCSFSLDIIGADGDISKTKLNLIIKQNKLSDFITVHGKKIGEDKNRLILNSDIFIHPTHDDCFPFSSAGSIKIL